MAKIGIGIAVHNNDPMANDDYDDWMAKPNLRISKWVGRSEKGI